MTEAQPVLSGLRRDDWGRPRHPGPPRIYWRHPGSGQHRHRECTDRVPGTDPWVIPHWPRGRRGACWSAA